MDNLSSIILGVVQGLTEFLPISSSGHLVLFQNLLGFKEPELILDISLHVGTLLAVLIYFRADLKEMIVNTVVFILELFRGQKKTNQVKDDHYTAMTLWVIVGSVPTAFMGLCFKSFIEELFSSIFIVGCTLIVTGIFLAISRLAKEDGKSKRELGLLFALIIGVAQGLALVPGISRSGSTIVCGLMLGLKKETAARFSFLLSIPAIFGAMVLELGSAGLGDVPIMPLFSGLIVAAVVGILALKILMGFVRKGKLFYFAPYCWAVGLVVLLTV